MRVILAVAAMGLMLTGCAIDPCSIDSTSPSCAANRAVAQQTISVADATREAIAAQAAMKATQNAVAMKAQATQGAINSRATALAVEQAATRGARAAEAEGTRAAIELGQLRESVAMSATMSAMVLRATQEAIRAEATQTALIGEARVTGASVQAAAAGWQQMIVVLLMSGGTVALVAGGLWYARRLAQASVHGLEVRTSLVRYGPGQSHWALVSPGKDGQKHVLLTDGIVGAYSSSDGLVSTLTQLGVPSNVIVQVLADQMKRSQLVLAAQAVGQLPGATSRTETIALPGGPSAPAVISASQTPALPEAPALTDLLARWTPTPKRMMLGVGRDGPLYGTIDDMLSIGVIGRPKTGKTTLLRFVYAQCALIGAQVVVWDMHRNLVKEIPGANVYTQLEQIESSAVQVAELLRERLRMEAYNARALMVMVDEFPMLSRVSEAVVDTVGRVVLEGRKVNMYVMVAGQGFPANLFGGSLVRDAFSSRYVCHTSTRQAQMAGLDNESASWVRNLTRGYAVLDGPVDPQIVAYPNCSRDDVTRLIAGSTAASGGAEYATSATSDEVGATSSEVDGEAAAEAGDEVDVRIDRVREMLRQRVPASKIVREVWGVSGGDAYQRAAREYSEIVAQIVGGA